jgi:hypothetical protein
MKFIYQRFIKVFINSEIKNKWLFVLKEFVFLLNKKLNLLNFRKSLKII